MTTSVSRISIILYIQFKIRTSSLPVICENWHSTSMWKTLLWTASFNLRRQCNLFYPPLFIEEPAPSQESGRSCIRVVVVFIFAFVSMISQVNIGHVVMVAYYLFFILSEKIVYAAEMQILPVNIYIFLKFYFHFARFHLL